MQRLVQWLKFMSFKLYIWSAGHIVNAQNTAVLFFQTVKDFLPLQPSSHAGGVWHSEKGTDRSLESGRSRCFPQLPHLPSSYLHNGGGCWQFGGIVHRESLRMFFLSHNQGQKHGINIFASISSPTRYAWQMETVHYKSVGLTCNRKNWRWY